MIDSCVCIAIFNVHSFLLCIVTCSLRTNRYCSTPLALTDKYSSDNIARACSLTNYSLDRATFMPYLNQWLIKGLFDLKIEQKAKNGLIPHDEG